MRKGLNILLTKLSCGGSRRLLQGGCTLLVCLVLGAQGLCQQYQKEVFLRLPVFTVEEGMLWVPQSIGVDFDDHFCILQGGVLAFYDQKGDTLHVLTVEPGDDFCFDEQDNIYIYSNGSGEVEIHKYDKDGKLLGTMTNSMDTVVSQPPMGRFLGQCISYLSGVGLFLSDGHWVQIPVDFIDGCVPDMTSGDRRVDHIFTASNRYVKGTRESRTAMVMSLYEEGTPTKEVRFEGWGLVGVEIVYSLDTEHQYYFWFTDCSGCKDYQRHIAKYRGDEPIFATDILAPSMIDYLRGKDTVVDSKGIIYYYWGDEHGIEIIRWSVQG